ncbi:MAG: maleylpyruvate isomerase family mycothiol-dependent enzyme [Pseudonocardia sp.]|nr:maleylpyruvate isomerase family mycothiol-dependent enzyme [Pseudonocardia sp.]
MRGPLPLHLGRSRGNFDRLNHDLAIDHAARPPDRLVAELREHAASRRLPVVTTCRNLLFDVLVHVQDIAIPLGVDRAMPVAAAREGVQRVWSMDWPFHARRRLGGMRLVATDSDWSAGAGPEVHGTTEVLLLLLTGRTVAAQPRLTGPGCRSL